MKNEVKKYKRGNKKRKKKEIKTRKNVMATNKKGVRGMGGGRGASRYRPICLPLATECKVNTQHNSRYERYYIIYTVVKDNCEESCLLLLC